VKGNNQKLSNVNQVLEAIRQIGKIPGLDSVASTVDGKIPRPDQTGILIVHDTIFSEIQNQVGALRTRATLLQTSLKAVVAPQDVNTIYFRVPPELDLKDFGTVIGTIDLSFKQILGTISPETSVKFKGVDSGSVWLVRLVSGKVGLVMKAIEYAMKLAAKGIDLRKQYLEMESLEIDVEVKKKQGELHKLQIDALTRKFAKSLAEESTTTGQVGNEEMLRLSKAMSDLRDIIERGATVEVPLVAAREHREQVAEIAKTALQLENRPTALIEAQDKSPQ
jgi:hypothetical protein